MLKKNIFHVAEIQAMLTLVNSSAKLPEIHSQMTRMGFNLQEPKMREDKVFLLLLVTCVGRVTFEMQ